MARGNNGLGAKNAASRAEKKQRIVELLGQAKTYQEVEALSGVPMRTFQSWRERDEKFALEMAAAEKAGTDFLVARLRMAVEGEVILTQQQLLAAFFLIKKRDPSYRDNHKVEHVVSGGLAGALKQLAKMGRE
jgi:hypothetical protein